MLPLRYHILPVSFGYRVVIPGSRFGCARWVAISGSFHLVLYQIDEILV